jgi:cytochrome c1
MITTAKRKDVEKKDLLSKMDRLFRISPLKVKAADGSGQLITVEHRIGREAGFFTLRDLMEKLGLEDEHAQFIKDMIKQIKNPDERKEVCDAHYVRQKSKAQKVVSDYRKHMEVFYGNYARPLLPALGFVPVTDGDLGLYVQGLVDANTYELLVGEAEDIYRWTETVFTKTKKWADLNKRAELQAKALMKCHGISKDIRHRLQAITQGEIPPRLGFAG